MGPKWHLTASAEGKTLVGTWTDAGKSLPLALTLAGSRGLPADFDGTTAGLAGIVDSFSDGELALIEKLSPCRFSSLRPVAAAAVTDPGPGAFHYVTDPRTKFRFPRIDALVGADPALANDYLTHQHWQLSLAALSCAAQLYQGLGWNEPTAPAAGSLAGYEDEQVDVSYLSPTLMSWTESGSTFCGGAHDNDRDIYNLDVRAGKALDLNFVFFTGWVPIIMGESTQHRPNCALTGKRLRLGHDRSAGRFCGAHRVKARIDFDSAAAPVIASNLAISFLTPTAFASSLAALPASSPTSYSGDLFDLPIAKVKSLLTPEAADFFPSLRK